MAAMFGSHLGLGSAAVISSTFTYKWKKLSNFIPYIMLLKYRLELKPVQKLTAHNIVSISRELYLRVFTVGNIEVENLGKTDGPKTCFLPQNWQNWDHIFNTNVVITCMHETYILVLCPCWRNERKCLKLRGSWFLGGRFS